MTADRCIALGARWCCLKTWIGSEGDAHQPLVTAERGPEGVRHVTWPQENEKLSFSHSHVFYRISTLLLENLRAPSDKELHGGQVIRTM